MITEPSSRVSTVGYHLRVDIALSLWTTQSQDPSSHGVRRLYVRAHKHKSYMYQVKMHTPERLTAIRVVIRGTTRLTVSRQASISNSLVPTGIHPSPIRKDITSLKVK